MKGSFVHFIISRVNLGRPGDGFYRARLPYFTGLTYPSVSRQEGEFRWLLLMDPESSPQIIRDMKERVAGEPRAIVLNEYKEWVGGHPSIMLAGFVPTKRGGKRKERKERKEREKNDPVASWWGPRVVSLVNEWVDKFWGEEDYCIQTRLDTDDMIAQGFVSAVQAQARLVDEKDDSKFLNFPRGYRWDHTSRMVLPYRGWLPNQFVSLVTRQRSRSVYERPHGRITDKVTVETLQPMWVWSIHHQGESTQYSAQDRLSKRKAEIQRGGVPDTELLYSPFNLDKGVLDWLERGKRKRIPTS